MGEVLTYESWTEERVARFHEECKDYFDVLKWVYRHYKPGEVVYACSFGAEAMVLLHLLYKVNKQATVVFLDTGLHFKETYALIGQIKDLYPELDIKLSKPPLSLEQQGQLYGEKLWETNPNLCCQLRKIEPLKEALQGAKAWITGLRREQSETRKNVEYINKDDKFQKIKICPLIHWKWEDIWTYIKLNGLPYNPLHEQQYPSIGCEPCTQRVDAGARDLRAGRWANQNKTECGLHYG